MTSAHSIRMPPDIRSVRIGDHQAVFIDNFLADPKDLLKCASQGSYAPYPNFEQRKGYPGIRAEAPSEYSLNLTELLEPLIKLNFQVPEPLRLRKSICAFSLMTVPPHELSALQSTPHFDASTDYHMAVLLYLCGEDHGGTAFYRHNSTGIQQVTPSNRDLYLETYYREITHSPPKARYFDQSNEQFTLLGMIPAKFNRLVVYPGSLIHSAVIEPSRSICADPTHGRLTVNTFFDF